MSETRPTPPPPDGVVGVFERLAGEVAAWATDPTGPSGTVLGGILARHGLVNVAEVARLRADLAERDERLARIAECLRQMVGWDDCPPANGMFAMALVQVAGIARGDS